MRRWSWFALGAVAVLAGCRRHHYVVRQPEHLDPELGTLPVRAPAGTLIDALSLVRARLAHVPTTPAASLARGKPHRAFVTVFAPQHAPWVTSAYGPDLSSALTSGADALAADVPSNWLAKARIQIDLPVDRKPLAPGKERDPGARGLLVTQAGKLGYVLPSELFSRSMLGVDDEPDVREPRLAALLDERLGAPSGTLPRTRFATVSFVESADHRRALPLEHGRPPRLDPDAIDAAVLHRSVELAAGYLARMVGPDGHFVYMYDAAADRPVDEEYNDIRHAGATDALFEAFEELQLPTLEVAGERALDALDRKLREVTPGTLDGGLYLPDDDNPLGTIGGTGLSLIAYCAHYRGTKDPAYMPRMQAMARFLQHQLDPSGRFQPFAPGGVDPSKVYDVMYYYGEAMLGLLRLYEVDHDQAHLDAAARAATWRLSAPYQKPREKHRDYWYALSLAVLHRITGEVAFAERAQHIAEGTFGEIDEDDSDFRSNAGRFYDTPRASPTAVALEAIAADVPLYRARGLDTSRLWASARLAASYVLFAQLDEESAYFARDPERALGGIHGDPWAPRVRIDDVQHGLMALMTFERALRGR